MKKLLDSLNWQNLEVMAEAARPAVGLDLVYHGGDGFKETVAKSSVSAVLLTEFCAELLEGWARSAHSFDLTAAEKARGVFEEAKSAVFAREANGSKSILV